MTAGLEAFARALAADDQRIELARACLLVAEDAYPGVDVARYLAELERIALDLRARLSRASAPEDKVIALNQLMFDELGYRGNSEDYYDPRNSYLNEVLERRTGIPITLSIVYMELGRRIGLPLEGVSFPGHFMVRLRLPSGILVLDPFAGGAPQSAAELRDRLARVIPPGATGGLPIAVLPIEQFVEPAGNRQILARLLRNLKGIYREHDQPERLLQVLNRMLLVSPRASTELRERGYVYQRLECFRAALEDLSAYLEREPRASDAAEVRVTVTALAGLCARLN